MASWLRTTYRSQLPHALLLVIALLAASCTKDIGNIGVGLPDSQANTGAYLIDTVTVRASTVLRDSVVTSNSDNLLVGRYTDPQLGTLTAKSYFQVGLTDAFHPDATFVYDSTILVLRTATAPKPDSFIYGDTTKTQALFEVHPLIDPISITKPSFASPKLTRLNYDSTTLLNLDRVAPRGRVRPTKTTLRLPLDDNTFGRKLLLTGQMGLLSTQDLFDNYLPGLVLTPAAGDDAAIVRLSASASGAALMLYYHDPTNPTVVLSSTFSLANGNRHFYQVKAGRSTAAIRNLPTASLQSVNSSLTGMATVVEGALGLQTRLEFPYLTDLQQFGANLTVTNARITALVPASTLSPFVPVPPNLLLNIPDANNHPLGLYANGSTVAGEGTYQTGISAQSGIEQGSYFWSVDRYIQGVINRTTVNNGFLISSAASALPNRVVLGGPRNTTNKLALRIYFITVK
ncbi:DUF4270 family protein [Hymenobacter sp. UV11]|uniref:DUF4270 family protein n=1 Tax=Hymenobacter sp. UV11 TaxID=1849735 RepID=UPI0010E1A141|nr:DUF4270 family protein [Hymenobacter sp. UV11]TDN40186.1 hypothetical protein A8B98_14960 [Hymenobacter sp. UV11]